MSKSIWFREACGVVLAVTLLATASVHAQTDSITGPITDDKGKVVQGEVIILGGPDGDAASPTRRWLGISLEPAPEVLLHHLKIEGGVIVGKVMADSPAKRAKLLRFDIITQCGDKAIKNPSDLIAKVANGNEETLLLKILREGQPVDVSITPMAAPTSITFKGMTGKGSNGSTLSGDMKIDVPGHFFTFDNLPGHLRVFGPGLAFDVKTPKESVVPSGLSIAVSKVGDAPVKIVVKRGDESWQTTEDNLDDLPKDIRPYVERLLGRHGFNSTAAPHAGDIETLRARIAPAIKHGLIVAKEHADQGLVTAKQHVGNVQKVLDQVLSELEELRLEIHQLRESKESGNP